jgi:cysteine desulfurase
LETALELAYGELDDTSERLAELRDQLQRGIEERIPDVELNGHPTLRLPNILNMSFVGVEGESLLMALDTQGIAVSTGSACTAGSTDPSHVLQAMGVPRDRAQGSLRFSLGRENDAEQIAYVIDTLAKVVERLRELSPTYPQAERA